MVICGGGHVSAELVKMASCLDFRIKVIDDREEFISFERFPLADEVICDHFQNLEKYMVQDGYYATHHPFTRPKDSDIDKIEYNPAMFIYDDWLWLFFLNFMNRVIRFQSIKGRKVYGVMDLI